MHTLKLRRSKILFWFTGVPASSPAATPTSTSTTTSTTMCFGGHLNYIASSSTNGFYCHTHADDPLLEQDNSSMMYVVRLEAGKI